MRSIVVTALALLLSEACPSARLFAQQPTRIPSNGLELFANLAHTKDLTPIARLERLFLYEPDNTLVVILGDNKVIDDINLEVGGLPGFLQCGGALLVATDRPDQGRLQPFKLGVSGQSVHQSTPASYRRKYPECPLIPKGLHPKHPLFMNAKLGLATNNPSFLRGTKPAFSPLASFPADCQRVSPPQALGPEDRYMWGSPAHEPPDGRALFIAGHGVFMNSMLSGGDNDNFEFARRCLNWLSQGRRGPRQFALILVDGAPMTRFTMPLTPPLLPPFPREPIINRMLDGVQKEQILDQMLFDALGRNPVLRGLLLGVTLTLLCFAARRLMQGRHRFDSSVPLLVALADHPVIKPLLAQRDEALQATGNLWEPAQVLIRQWFIDHGVQAPLWEEDVPPPLLQGMASPAELKRLQRRVAQLWSWTNQPPNGSLAPRRFCNLMADLETLAVHVRARRLRFGEGPIS